LQKDPSSGPWSDIDLAQEVVRTRHRRICRQRMGNRLISMNSEVENCSIRSPKVGSEPMSPSTVQNRWPLSGTAIYWTGIVRTGASGTTPVSASEKNSSRKVKERFEVKSWSETQYQVSR
jgi:hypothetical protein